MFKSLNIIALIFAVLGCGKMEEKNMIRKIEISTPRSEYLFAESIPLRVTYFNLSKITISFLDPAKSQEVAISLTDMESNSQLLPVGRTLLEDNGKIVKWKKEPADTIEIKSGENYSFTVDPADRWLDIFCPGRFSFHIVDESLDPEVLKSNDLSIAIRFAGESVDALLRIAADETQSQSKRNVAVRWLRKFRKGLSLKYSQPQDSDVLRSANANFNSAQIADYSSWWLDASRSPEVAARIDEINTVYFDQRRRIGEFDDE